MAQAEQTIEFVWPVARQGYEWITLSRPTPPIRGEPSQTRFLVERDTKTPRTIVQAPLRNFSGLFRTFADTDASEEGVVEFARTHGRLRNPPIVDSPVPGDSWWIWISEILTMRHLIGMWEATRSGDGQGLSDLIAWENDPVSCVIYRGWEQAAKNLLDGNAPWLLRPEVIAAENMNPGLLASFSPYDLIRPALYRVQRVVNEKLREHRVVGKMLWDQQQTRLSLYFHPGTLIGALWVQFAQAIDGDRRYGCCQECGRWFDLTTDRRADAKYCSGACRSKAYRQRQIEARRLSRAGFDVVDIAKRVGTNRRTVEGWLGR